MNITKGKVKILQYLLDCKRANSPFIKLSQFRRSSVWELAKEGLIFASKGIDGTRYTITRAGEKALILANKPVFRYFWEGRGYATIKALSEGENMSYNQARWRAKNGYTSNRQLKHGGAVVIAGIEYENSEVARIALGYADKRTISKIVVRQRNGTFKRINAGQKKRAPSTRKYLLQRAYERIMKG